MDLNKKVMIPGTNVDLALDWAKEHCTSYITNRGTILSAYSVPGQTPQSASIWYEFYFADAADALMFKLKWA
jgi:hypothetical protein